MADITSHPTIATVPRIASNLTVPKIAVFEIFADLIGACGVAATMLYVRPFGANSGPSTADIAMGEDGRDPRW